MSTIHPVEASVDPIVSRLEFFGMAAQDGLTRVSAALDRTMGAEVTTALAVALGLLSLVLALLPVWSWFKQPQLQAYRSLNDAPGDAPSDAPREVLRNAAGEELAQMHPECLEALYGISPTLTQPEVSTIEPEKHHDLSLGLLADLSEEVTQQRSRMAALSLQIQALTTQMKAQASAFLLQGERLLILESSVAPENRPADTELSDIESEQRLSTFDQAIELATHGATAEALMLRCGLSVSEARLVVLVHGKPATVES